MGFHIMGIDHLKARCLCRMIPTGGPRGGEVITEGCPLHDMPTPVPLHTCASGGDLGPVSGCPACTAHLKHRNPCMCTIDSRTGAVVDYDCAVATPAPIDMVNHPPHYTGHPSGIEAIDIGRHLTADWFNAFKYIFRCDLKNGRQDVEKALWYAKDGVEHKMSVHAPTWGPQPDARLREVIVAEADPDKVRFFCSIRMNNGEWALRDIEKILEGWPL